jgi:hypothetical protein
VEKLASPLPFSVPLPIVPAPSWNVTVPVGVPDADVTVAVNVTDCPVTDGFADEITAVDVLFWFTVWECPEDVEPAYDPLPP